MSHIHIPDGVLPVQWLVAGYSGAIVLLVGALYRLRSRNPYEYMGKIGIVSAAMILAMSIPLGFLPVHMNLAVLSGVLLGPWAGVISVWVVNTFMALVGHGGITVLGLNVFLVSVEMLIGVVVFRLCLNAFSAARSATAASVVSLSVASVVLITFVGLVAGAESAAAFGYGRAAMTVLPVSIVGILIETAVVTLVVAYLDRVRPDLLRR